MDMIWQHFHFIRPWALLGLLPLLWLLRRKFSQHGQLQSWQQVIAPQLLNHLWVGIQQTHKPWFKYLFAIWWLIAIFALAGPSYEKQPLPLVKAQQYKVILLDLSYSMYATDLKPNRLTKAKQKIIDLVKQNPEGQTALISYAGTAHVISPLTDDVETIINLVPALDPDIMPAKGSRADHAIQSALNLLQQVNAQQGHIVLLTDGVADEQQRPIQMLLENTPYQLHILPIGTAAGAPIPFNDGFLKQRGQIVMAKLDVPQLQQLAQKTGAQLVPYSLNNQDIKQLTLATSGDFNDMDTQDTQTEHNQDYWIDLGPWLLLIALPFVALSYRKGWLLVLCISLSSLPIQPARAALWQDLWLNNEQQAQKAFDAEDYTTAADSAQDPLRRGAALYKAGDYEGAAQAFSAGNSAELLYNKGNALAHLQRYQEALDAYNAALQQQPDYAKAQKAKGIATKLLLKQQEDGQLQGSQQQNGQQQDGQQQDGQQQDGQQQNGQQQNGQQQNGQQQNGQQQDGQQQDGQQQDGQQQDGQQQDGQQQDGQQQNGQQSAVAKTEDSAEADNEDENQQATASAQLNQPQMTLQQQQMQQLLQAVPDDPSGLLKNKFYYQYQKRKQPQQPMEQQWW